MVISLSRQAHRFGGMNENRQKIIMETNYPPHMEETMHVWGNASLRSFSLVKTGYVSEIQSYTQSYTDLGFIIAIATGAIILPTPLGDSGFCTAR